MGCTNIDTKTEDDVDEITIRYKIEDSKRIQIFGCDFVANNRNLCKIIVNKEEFDLTMYQDANINQINNSIFEIKLKGIKNITNMSYMFSGCESLSYLPDISKFNTQNVTKMTEMFYGCVSLSSLPDISKWNTQSVTDMESMFSNCNSLSSLPDISKWNTQNVTNMS